MKQLRITGYALLLGFFGIVTDAHPEEDVEEAKTLTISKHGERVDLAEHLVKGKYTIFEFYADWSPECQKYGRQIAAEVKRGDGMVLRRINIRSWGAPVEPEQPHWLSQRG